MPVAAQTIRKLVPSPLTDWSVKMATVRAGSPSFVDGDGELINLNNLILKDSTSTYAVSACEDVPELGIVVGDMLIVDRHAKPTHNSIVLVELDSYFAVKQFSQVAPSLRLVTSPNGSEQRQVWGVVTFSIRKYS